MSRQKINGTKYLTVFAITTLIFLLGLILGNFVSGIKMNQLEDLENDLRTDTMAIEMQYLLLAEDPCKALNTTPLTNELHDIASRLDYMENRLGDKDPEVLRLKEYYSLLELRHWTFFKRTNKECGFGTGLILYFYSDKKNCPVCEEQGFILTYIRKKFPHVNVYSFDINLENVAMRTVKELHGVQNEKAPVIIINGKPFIGFTSKDVIEQALVS